MPAANIIPFELPLPHILPTIEGNVDYRDLRDQLLRISSLLVQSDLETQMLEADLQRWLGSQKRVSAKAQQKHQLHARRALRCNIARLLLKEQYRGFAARLADSPLLQFFCGISEVDRVVVPSKQHPRDNATSPGGPRPRCGVDPQAPGPGSPGPGTTGAGPAAGLGKRLSGLHVIVRKKAGAEVEFGNTLFLAENPQGLILDWELFRESAPADAALLPRTVARMQEAYAPGPKALAGDRGFDSELNRFGLNEEKIFNAVCPRSPGQLRQRNRSWKFKRMQRRRAQTEGRIGIVKNVFLGGRMRCKGFEHRELTVTWTVLVHNLWVLARLPRAEAAEAHRRAA